MILFNILFNSSSIAKDKKYIEKILSEIKEDFRFHTHERLLKQIIIQSNTRKRAIKFLLNSFDADKVRYFISGNGAWHASCQHDGSSTINLCVQSGMPRPK